MVEPTLLRPRGVPAVATLVRPAVTFAELDERHRTRPDHRLRLRIAVRFVIIDYVGVLLCGVDLPRALSIRVTPGRMSHALVFNGPGLTPPVWVWSPADVYDDEVRDGA